MLQMSREYREHAIVHQRDPAPGNVRQLRQALEKEWDNIPQVDFDGVIASMRQRCVALCEANGGHTRY